MRCSFALAVAFSAASLVSAQTGSFSTYGAGCKGTGGNATCHSANMACGTGWGGGNTSVFATSFKVASTRATTGARLRTSGAGSFHIELWKTDAAGKPKRHGRKQQPPSRTTAPNVSIGTRHMLGDA